MQGPGLLPWKRVDWATPDHGPPTGKCPIPPPSGQCGPSWWWRPWPQWFSGWCRPVPERMAAAGRAVPLNSPVMAAGIRDFTFHDGHAPALHDLAVSVAPGSFTVILGASGSGKSTLGRLLAGWLAPGGHGTLAGFLELAGTRLDFDGGTGDPRIDPAQWGRQVGFVPQDPAGVLSTVRATVAEELAFGLENTGMDR